MSIMQSVVTSAKSWSQKVCWTWSRQRLPWARVDRRPQILRKQRGYWLIVEIHLEGLLDSSGGTVGVNSRHVCMSEACLANYPAMALGVESIENR